MEGWLGQITMSDSVSRQAPAASILTDASPEGSQTSGQPWGELLRSRVPMAGALRLPVCGGRGGDGAVVPQSPVLPGFKAEPHAHPALTH